MPSWRCVPRESVTRSPSTLNPLWTYLSGESMDFGRKPGALYCACPFRRRAKKERHAWMTSSRVNRADIE